MRDYDDTPTTVDLGPVHVHPDDGPHYDHEQYVHHLDNGAILDHVPHHHVIDAAEYDDLVHCRRVLRDLHSAAVDYFAAYDVWTLHGSKLHGAADVDDAERRLRELVAGHRG